MKRPELKDIHLPHWTNQLIDAAGIDAAMKLSLELGGSRLQIPEKSSGTILEETVGTIDAEKIVGAFSGAVINIPMNNTALIVWLRDKGWDQEKTASRMRISRRRIHRILFGQNDTMPIANDFTTEP